jgi:hypothetical protein
MLDLPISNSIYDVGSSNNVIYFFNNIVIGYDAPKLSLEKLSYHPGEIGRANCTLEKSWPQVNITWLLNDKQVTKSFLSSLLALKPK